MTKKRSGKKPGPKSPVNTDLDLAERITLKRRELKMSQSQLAEKLGVSYQQVQKYEAGTNRIGAARLSLIAKALGVPMHYFFGTSETTAEVDSLLSLDSAISIRLLRAYTAIKNQALQRQFVIMIEVIVASQGD